MKRGVGVPQESARRVPVLPAGTSGQPVLRGLGRTIGPGSVLVPHRIFQVRGKPPQPTADELGSGVPHRLADAVPCLLGRLIEVLVLVAVDDLGHLGDDGLTLRLQFLDYRRGVAITSGLFQILIEVTQLPVEFIEIIFFSDVDRAIQFGVDELLLPLKLLRIRPRSPLLAWLPPAPGRWRDAFSGRVSAFPPCRARDRMTSRCRIPPRPWPARDVPREALPYCQAPGRVPGAGKPFSGCWIRWR